MNRTIERQLARVSTLPEDIRLKALVDLVSATYDQHERDRKHGDRANALMADELTEMLAVRDQAAAEKVARMVEMERAQTEIAASEARVRHLAYHDVLTGLPNRAMFGDRLAHALEASRRNHGVFAVHCIDLDQFKAVNDTFGHQAGDELIRAAAARLMQCARKSDTVARLGGDEFAIIQSDATPLTAATFANRIVGDLAMPITLSVGQVYVGCSVGVTIVEDPSIEALEMLRQADLALYKAKGEGRGRYAFFEPEMDAAIRTRRILQKDLREALANDLLELAYQPQVNGKGELAGVEALARWNHPVRGPIPPSLFVPIAEECGLIVELGFFTLRRAFQQGARWPHLNVAINISAYQLRMRNFVEHVKRLIEETGISPERFELEITEGVLLGDDPVTYNTLRSLRELGFSLALDDFGTGYSSLSYLQRFPIDKIKIDRSFIKNIGVEAEAEAVIGAIVKLADALHLKVVAEGVETTEQHAALVAAGCDDVQGYLFGKPMAASMIDGLVRERKLQPA
jgi:diguanylate cyclase (GGDEF)-like protein